MPNDAAPNPFGAWCAQHGMHPKECWELHSLVRKVGRPLTQEEHAAQIVEAHLKGQALLDQCIHCGKYTKDMTEHLAKRCTIRKELSDPKRKRREHKHQSSAQRRDSPPSDKATG